MGRRGRNNFTEESISFVTTTVVNFLPIFENTAFCGIRSHWSGCDPDRRETDFAAYEKKVLRFFAGLSII